MLIPWMNRFYSPNNSFSSWTVWAMSVSELEGTLLNFSMSSFMWLNRGSKITQSVTGLVSLQPQCIPPSLCPAWGNGCHDLQQPVYAFLEIRTWVNQQRCILSLEIPAGSWKVSWTRVFPSSLPDPTSRKGTWGSHNRCRGPGRSESSKSAPQSRPAPGCPGGLKLSLILEDESAVKLLPLTLVLMRPLN